MSIRGWAPGRLVDQPRGMWQSLKNRRNGVPARASDMQNARIRFGTVRTRAGTSAVFASIAKVTGMFNWIEPSGTNVVIYQRGVGIFSYDQASATSTTLANGVVGRAPSVAPFDVWAYIAAFDTSNIGVIAASVYDGVNVDLAFRGPPTVTAWTAVDGGTGQCTQGLHYLGFVYQNRTGYSGVPVTGIDYTISAATNASPSVITATGNNLFTGQVVSIASALGNTAINGTALTVIVGTPGSTFTLTDANGNPVNGNGAYTGGGILTSPMQINLAAGQRQANISVSLPALTDGGADANGAVQSTLFLIGTRADNPAIWYFLGSYDRTGQIGEQPVPHNAPVTLNFVFSLSDEDIAAALAGDTAQDNFLFLAEKDNNFPFFPSFVVAYGNRMCYGVGSILYVSDQQNPQQIAADRNAVQMLNQRSLGYAFPLAGNTGLYLTGDRWTSYVTDNNDIPATWSPPVTVSTTLGAPFPNCVCSDTGGPWAWVVTEAGPYLFDGNYGLNPLTYLISGYDELGAPIGWKRVNWSAAYAIKIADDVQNLKLYIAAPLDGATEPNYLFVIDYRLGKAFDSVDLSLDVFTPQAFSSIAVVKEYATGLSNLWLGPGAAGNVTRFDVSTHNDQGAAIDGYWTSGLARGPNIVSSMIRVGAMDIWARGNAPLDTDGNPTFLVTLFGPDGQAQVPITLLSTQGVPAALVERPGLTYMSKFDVNQIEDYYVQFRTNSVDAWMELSAFRTYEKQDLFNR